VDRLGFTTRRKVLLNGLREALALLKGAGCRLVYLDGSFVTSKPEPGDFDACWGIDGVDVDRLDPVFPDFANSRARQKQRFDGEFFPAELPEGATGRTFLEFFQVAAMIKNERQYHFTKAQAEKFARTIAEVTANPKGTIHPALRKAELDGLKSQLEDLKSELQEYEALRSGKRRVIALGSIEELPKTLIQARIAAGLSQEDLAAKLGLKPQQVQRYEATNYQSASLERNNKIMRVLGVKLRHPAELRLVS
jgi:ribosome-binding protein aMBF1 (putative translation factor)